MYCFRHSNSTRLKPSEGGAPITGNERYSSDFGCVYTFTPLLNETGRIFLKTAHVAATKAGALIMRVPFRSAPGDRLRQPVLGRAAGPGGRGRGGGGGEGDGGGAQSG